MRLILDLLGICLGNTLWLLGLVLAGVGIWGLRANQEKVMKLVGMLSIASVGQPQGLAEKLAALVQPKDRTTPFGLVMLAIGMAAIMIGCYLIKVCR